VRELSNVLERGVILCSDDTVTPIDLPTELGVAPPPPPSVTRGEPRLTTEPLAQSLLGEEGCNLERSTLAFQRDHVMRVLDQAEGNREAAAKLLGLSPATLYRYLQKLGLKGYRVDEDRHG
jgi:DNA-binding NtrC family response regulator